MDLKGKNVIYIGGFGGIGQKCVEELLKREVDNLFIFELISKDEYLKSLQEKFPSSKIEYIMVDMSKVETVENAYTKVMEKVGQIDMVVNGSGLLNERLIDLTVAVNLTGVIHSNLIALNYMSKAKGGCGGVIVNIASVAGLEPLAFTAVYSATKSGLINFSKSMANPCYYQNTGVSFVVVCPGATITGIVRDLASKSTFPEYYEEIRQSIAKHVIQTAEQFAQEFIKILDVAENGTIWTIEGGNFQNVN
ncbi:alcohol dehydrogenase 1-like [Musca autumnalis]|uniref:alcohol dehydrogenase 1-like n=1 Tax=Musca autumnalis TaxID=221902 RepID=UPI003CE71BB2